MYRVAAIHTFLTRRLPYEDWCLESELNQRHVDFQSTALPTELSRHIRQLSRYRSITEKEGGDPKGTRTPDL